jgi:hypothetical protein
MCRIFARQPEAALSDLDHALAMQASEGGLPSVPRHKLLTK